MNANLDSELPPTMALRKHLTGLLRVDDHEVVVAPDKVIAFRGTLLADSAASYEAMSQRFAAAGYTAWLRKRPGGGHEVLASKGVSQPRPPRNWLNLILFIATLLSVLYVGAGYGLEGSGLLDTPLSPGEYLALPLRYLHLGVPFAATLMGILLTHELSHYVVARKYGSPVGLPYFIPLPFNILGTMGAVIVQKGPMKNRKALLDIGMAGPLGGLVVAIPLLILGLALSEVGPPPPNAEVAWQEGNSLLYLALKYLVFGRILPSGGEDVWLHPIAFAAWSGLLVTMINLIPVGQLDGGHVSYALLGRRSWALGFASVGVMAAWGMWLILAGNQAGSFWVTWGLLNLAMNRLHPPPLDDASGIGLWRYALGLLLLLVFLVTLMPAPLQQVAL